VSVTASVAELHRVGCPISLHRPVANSAGHDSGGGGRRPDPAPRDGDWTCSACGANVFASKTEVGGVVSVSVSLSVAFCLLLGCVQSVNVLVAVCALHSEAER
jgi:hypothetical protein